MELVVGTNCYADIAGYNELITNNFLSNNPIRVFWDSLDDADKKSLIISSTSKYDKESFCYKGFKLDVEQPLQFPRINVYKKTIDCPDAIKLGIILNSLRDTMSENSTESEMRANGIKSFQDGTGAKIELEYSGNVSKSAMKTGEGVYRVIWETYFSEYSNLI